MVQEKMTRQRYKSLWVKTCCVFLFFCLGFLSFSSSTAHAQVQRRTRSNIRSVQQPAVTQNVSNAAKAKAAFAAGRYDLAIQFASADYSQNPGRRWNLLIIAQSYYRLGDVARAGQIFSSFKPKEVPASAAFDYTMVMFATRQYKQASVGWKKLSEKDPYRDIAMFYGGVAHMYLRQYSKASQLLRSARKLPANLKSERRRLLDEVDALITQSRTGQFTQDRSYAYQVQPRYAVPSPAAPAGPGGAAPAVKTPPPVTGFSFSGTPTFSYESESSKTDYNGYTQLQENTRIPAVSMPVVLKYTAKPRSFGGQPYLSLSVTPGYSDKEYSSQSSSLSAPVDNPTAVSSATSQSDSRSYKQTLVGVVEGLFPVSDSLDAIGSYKSDHTYPNGKASRDKVVSGPTAKLSFELDKFKFDGDFSIIDTDNYANKEAGTPVRVSTDTTMSGVATRNGNSSVAKVKVTSTETASALESGIQNYLGASLSLSKTLGDFTVEGSGSYISRTPYAETIIEKSPQSEQGGEASLSWSGTFAVSLAATAGYTLFDKLEYKFADGIVAANSGTLKNYKLSAGIPIFGSYGGLDLAYKYQDRQIKVADDADEAKQLEILKYYWSQSTVTSVKLTLKYPL